MHELSKEFCFDSAHTLERDVAEDKKQASLRIHGHSYRAKITLRGKPDPQTGMLVDLDTLELALASARQALDHRLLNDIPDMGPPTMENICSWIWRNLRPSFPALARVSLYRSNSGDSCAYFGEG